MAEYIERYYLLNWLAPFKDVVPAGIPQVLESIKSIPTADVAPMVHGKVVYRNRPEHYDSYKVAGQTEDGEPLYKQEHHIAETNPVGYCAECKKRLCSRFTNYCPNCGAKMDGGNRHEN